MGCCPGCGTELLSPREAAETLTVSDGRVRGILSRHPGRLNGGRVGWGWLVPETGVAGFTAQPTGIHLDGNGTGLATDQCPVCGERLLSVKETAAALRVSVSRVYAILSADPARLQAFHVGRLWVIPGQGLAAYQDQRKVLDALRKRDSDGTESTILVITPGKLPRGTDPALKIKVVYGPEVCTCAHVRTKAGKTFPHRAGGGDCPYKPRVLQGMLVAEILSEDGDTS